MGPVLRTTLLAQTLLALVPTTAMAQSAGAVSVRVDYRSADGCPSAAAFLERLMARSANLKPSLEGEGRPTLVVRVTRSGSSKRGAGATVHGELTVRDADGNEAKRSVDGDTCESVVDAVALMSAMALDPVGALEARHEGDTAATIPPVVPPAEPTVPSNEDDTIVVDSRPGLHVAVGAGGNAAFGIAPVVAPTGDAFVELRWTTRGLWSPSLRAGFEYAAASDARESDVAGGIRLTRSLATVDACPIAWSVGPVRLTPCVHLEGGAVSAEGLGVTPTHSSVRPWLAGGADGRVRYSLGRRFFLELGGGLDLPFVRDQFYVEPSTTVFKAPVVSGFLGAALGVTIL